MIERKEKSPRLLAQTMGDASKTYTPSVHQNIQNVKGLRTRDELEEQRDNLIYELSQLDALQSLLEGSSIEATARCIDYRACVAAAEEELNEVRQRLARFEVKDRVEAKADEAEREAEYWRAAL